MITEINSSLLYEISWVTDLFNPFLKSVYDDVLTAINGPRFIVSSSLLEGIENGIIKTTIILESQKGPKIKYQYFELSEDNPIHDLVIILQQISFSPVLIPVHIYDDSVSSHLLNDLEEIIKVIIEHTFNSNVHYVSHIFSFEKTDTMDDIRIIYFIPYINNDNPIFRPINDISFLYSSLLSDSFEISIDSVLSVALSILDFKLSKI